MGQWAKDGKFIYTGRRNEGGANFRAGECALFTESSAGYAGISSEAEFAFEVRPLPYWEGVGNCASKHDHRRCILVGDGRP